MHLTSDRSLGRGGLRETIGQIQQMYILMNWHIVRGEAATSPTRISGQVYGHSGFRPGDEITTSAIASYRIESDFVVVTTVSGSSYSLEKPLAAEPFARQRLIRYLDEQPGRPAPANHQASQRLPRLSDDPRVVLETGVLGRHAPESAEQEPELHS